MGLVICPKCYSDRIVKNGYNRHGKRVCKCKDCNRVFVLQLDRKRRLTVEDKQVISRLLKEGVAVRIVAQAFYVSNSTIYRVKNEGKRKS